MIHKMGIETLDDLLKHSRDSLRDRVADCSGCYEQILEMLAEHGFD